MRGNNPTIVVSFTPDDDDHTRWVRDTLVKNLNDRFGVGTVMMEQGFDNYMDNIIPFLSGEPRHDFLICVCTPQYAKIANELHIDGLLPNLINAPHTAFERFHKTAAVIRKGGYKDSKPKFLMYSEGILMAEEESDDKMERLFTLVRKGIE